MYEMKAQHVRLKTINNGEGPGAYHPKSDPLNVESLWKAMARIVLFVMDLSLDAKEAI